MAYREVKKILSKYALPSRKLKLKMILFGTTLGFSSCFYYLTIQYVPVSVGIILLMQSIWMGVVVDLITTKGNNSRMKIVGALIAITGTLLAANVFESTMSLHPLGLTFGLLAAVSFTSFMFFQIYSVIKHMLLLKVNTLSMVASLSFYYFGMLPFLNHLIFQIY